MEEWKDIVGYEGIYQISSHGRVKSMSRKVRSRNGGLRLLPEKIIKPLFTSGGYLNIISSKQQVRGTLIIHHLVAHYFIGPRLEGLVIDHIDRDKTNNRVDNLRYVTPSGNQKNRKDNKLSEQAVQEIRLLLGKEPQAKIAAKYNVSQSHISHIKRGKLWKDV